MYNDELDMALESAYEDGYYQALADMGYEFDDEAIEDVDIFDEDCFDDAMEGNKFNKASRHTYDRFMAGSGHPDDIGDYRAEARSGSQYDRNINRRSIGADREDKLNEYGRKDYTSGLQSMPISSKYVYPENHRKEVVARYKKRMNDHNIRRDQAMTFSGIQTERLAAARGKRGLSEEDKLRIAKQEAKLYHTGVPGPRRKR